MGKNIGRNVSDKYSQKFLDHANSRNIKLMYLVQKPTEATNELIGNKIASKIIEVSIRFLEIVLKQLQIKQ